MITTDSAANMVSAIENLKEVFMPNVVHARCTGHILNLSAKVAMEHSVVQASIEKVRYFCSRIHRSPKLSEMLTHQQIGFNESQIKIVMDVVTRWNSTFDMLKTAQKIKLSLSSIANRLVAEKDSGYNPINDNDWLVVSRVISMLEPYSQGRVVKI
jgi:hypothetical protein